jgi:ribonuclease HI
VAAIPRAAVAAVAADATTIHTGASCLGAGPGGWAAVLRSGGEVWEVSGREERCSANALHLIAIERGLSLVPAGTHAHVVTPSDYAAQGGERWANAWASAGWRTRDGAEVKNRELWESILAQSRDLQVTWHSLKNFGRSEDAQRADRLAREAARKTKDE